jgi:hypothetical protein
MTEDKLRRLQTFLEFWFSPWGAAKGVIWEDLTGDRPFANYIAEGVCAAILAGTDSWVNWSVLDGK